VSDRAFTPSIARPPRVPPARGAARARGFTLIVAMLMLAIIGLASAAIMRNATSGDQAANSNRLQTQANQYAQLAMRFCENQLALAPAARAVTLLGATNPSAWTVQRSWTTSGANSAHTLSATDIGSATQPHLPPQCLLEATAVPDVYTITARGFSADFHADAATGSTRTGSAVWLQATIYAPGDGSAPGAAAASDSAPTLRQRLWQQLLTPPF
jgi:type IV pilus assembly protein PilX